MIAKISRYDGNRVIEINGVPYAPLAYRSFRPMPSNINLFYRSGVRLFQIQVAGKKNALGVPYSNYGGVWVGEHKYDFAPFDNQINMILKFAPGSKIMVMLVLDTPDFWVENRPGYEDSYKRVGEAVFYKEWIKDADDYIKSFLKYAENKYGENIFAYSFSAGNATEWFDDTNYYIPSEQKKKAFYEYSSGLSVPNEDELSGTDDICMRSPSSKEAQYRNFCCTLTPSLIKHFAQTFRDIIGKNKIIGLFYGYTDCPNVGYQIRSATNGYEEVWKDPNIDMLFSPAAYSYGNDSRELSGASSYQYLVDSVDINEKLYLHEIDHRTHLACYPLENGGILPSYFDLFTTVEVLRRELAAALCKGGSLWWFDFFGNYYACPELENEIALQFNIASNLLKSPHESISEIAVFADPLSFNLLEERLNITIDYVRSNRDALHKCGALFDYYNLSDITKIDTNKYKLFVFLFAPSISRSVRDVINSLNDKMKVFIHLPDVASKGNLDINAVGKFINMKLKIENDSDKAEYKGNFFGFNSDVKPLFHVVDKNAEPIANYKNGDVAVAFKKNIFYSSLSCIPINLWHDIVKRASVHTYTDKSVPIYADSRFIACQFPNEGEDCLFLKSNGKYTEVFTKKEYTTSNCTLTFKHYAHQMMMFVKNQ